MDIKKGENSSPKDVNKKESQIWSIEQRKCSENINWLAAENVNFSGKMVFSTYNRTTGEIQKFAMHY